ncbi:hypothetical protein ACL02S_23500 [Nocardia sp. 004]|uniref:hypothetical protein n=1 Tax=Nocardia sp. 004 TaxID=3385978 RepID=UPI0039A16DEF
MDVSLIPLPTTVAVVAILAAVAVILFAVADYHGGLGSWVGMVWRIMRASDPAHRRNEVLAARVLCGWPRTARTLRLRVLHRRGRVQIPRIRRVRADATGVTITVRTAPGIGLKKFRLRCRDLADYWGVQRVVCEQLGGGVLQLRLQTADLSADPAVRARKGLPLLCGTDTFGAEVTVDLGITSGIAVHGRIGTSAFVVSLLRQLVPDPTVRCVVLDGRNPDPFAGDYGVLAGGARVAMTGDDLEGVNRVLTELVALRRWRAERMSDQRSGLGVSDFWCAGPTIDWPLLVVVVDSYTSLLARTPGRSAATRHRNMVAEANTAAVRDLLAHGAQYGIVVLLTTAESLPQQLRELLSATFAFGCLGDKAAVAALGPRIRNFPEANPSGYTQPDMATTITPNGDYTAFRVSTLPAPLR